MWLLGVYLPQETICISVSFCLVFTGKKKLAKQPLSEL